MGNNLCCRRTQKSLFDSSRSPLALTDEIFAKYDRNGDGELDAKELRALFADAFPGQSVLPEHLSLITKCLDLDLDGAVGVNELRAFMRCYNPASKSIQRKSALLMVDVQNDYITGTCATALEAEQVVPAINGIRDAFNLVYVVKDWHPHEHCCFVESVNAGQVSIREAMTDFPAFATVTLLGNEEQEERAQCLYPRHAVAGSHGAACPPDLLLRESDRTIFKGTKANVSSYSAFFDLDKAVDTGLTKKLEADGVTDVYCCGLLLDIGVMSSALHGAEMGFRTVVIEDACRPFNPDSVPVAKQVLRQAGVAVMSSKEAVETLNHFSELCLDDYLAQVKLSKQAKAIHNSLTAEAHRLSSA